MFLVAVPAFGQCCATAQKRCPFKHTRTYSKACLYVCTYVCSMPIALICMYLAWVVGSAKPIARPTNIDCHSFASTSSRLTAWLPDCRARCGS